MRRWRCIQCQKLNFRLSKYCSSCGNEREIARKAEAKKKSSCKSTPKIKKKTSNNKIKEKNPLIENTCKEVELKSVPKKQAVIDRDDSDDSERYYIPPNCEKRDLGDDGNYNQDLGKEEKQDVMSQRSRSSRKEGVIKNLDILLENEDIDIINQQSLDYISAEEAIQRRYREDTESENLALRKINQSLRDREACECGIVRSWSSSSLSPEHTNRLRDFKYAREKRQIVYGDHCPWGILGMFEFLAGIRTDIEWANEICRRRIVNEPYISWSSFDMKKYKGLNRPFFTYFLLISCTIMMIHAIKLNNWKFESLQNNPMLGPSAEVLLYQGAKSTDLIVNKGEIWRIFSPMFLHAGIVHYLLNMMALRAIGYAVEQSHGSFAAAVIFCVPAIGGTILSALFLPEFISVGASGGIFGYIGACLADIAMNWSLLFSKEVNLNGQFTHHLLMVFWLFIDIGVNCLIGLTPFVDNFNHMGGLLYGFICGLALMDSISMGPKLPSKNDLKRKFRILCCIIVISVSIISSSIILFNGDGETSPCPSCKYVSCVSFPPWKDDMHKWWYCDACGDTTADVSTRNDDEHYYSDMILHCPDETSINVDISEYEVSDQSWLEKQLPFFCRQYCEDITF